MKQTSPPATTNGKLCCSKRCLFHITGLVEKGLGEARKIGFPTLNISYDLPQGTVFEVGVYAAEVRAEGEKYRAATCVGADWGTGQVPKFEVYLFDADVGGSWYGKTVEVKILKKIRDLVRFGNAEEARLRIAHDAESIKIFFADEYVFRDYSGVGDN